MTMIGTLSQHAPDAPEPAQNSSETNGREFIRAILTGHPGGDQGADEYGDHQRCSSNQQRRGERAELNKGHHPGGGGGEAGTEVRDDMQQTRGDGPRARVSRPIQRNAIQASSARTRLVINRQ